MIKSQFNIESTQGNFVYIYNTLTSSFIKIDAKEWNNIKEMDKEAQVSLYNNGFLVNSREEEINDYKFDFYASIFDDYTLSLYITPTMLCNFNCFYCFEDGHKKQGKMK